MVTLEQPLYIYIVGTNPGIKKNHNPIKTVTIIKTQTNTKTIYFLKTTQNIRNWCWRRRRRNDLKTNSLVDLYILKYWPFFKYWPLKYWSLIFHWINNKKTAVQSFRISLVRSPVGEIKVYTANETYYSLNSRPVFTYFARSACWIIWSW